MNDGSFDWGSLLGTGANALASYYGGQQINQAGQAAQQAADPYGPYRQVAATRLEGLQANPGSVAGLPGYQFGMDQGQQALERSGAAKGYLGSGNMLAALQNQAQGYAGQQYDKERLFQAGLAGANFNNSAQAAGYGMAGAVNQAQSGQLAANGLVNGLFGQGGAGNSLLGQGTGSASNYLSDLYAKNYGAGSGASGGTAGSVGGGPMSQTYDASGISGGGSSGGGGMPTTPPGSSNYISDLYGGGAQTGGLVPGYTAAGQGYALPGTAGSEGLMYGGDIGADAAYGAGAAAGESSATGATAYNALASTAEGAEGAATGSGAAGSGSGLAGAAVPLAVAAWAVNDFNKGTETNNAVVGTQISDAGGPAAFKQLIEKQIAYNLDPKNNAYGTSGDYSITGQPMDSQYQGLAPPPAAAQMQLFSGKFDTEMAQSLGPQAYADLRKRLADSQTKANTLLQSYRANAAPQYAGNGIIQNDYNSGGG